MNAARLEKSPEDRGRNMLRSFEPRVDCVATSGRQFGCHHKIYVISNRKNRRGRFVAIEDGSLLAA